MKEETQVVFSLFLNHSKHVSSNLKMTRTIIILILLLTLIGCNKTYDEGSNFSLLSKKKRLTNQWKLTTIKKGESSAPDSTVTITHLLELTKDEVSDGVYRAHFTSFQEEFLLDRP
jgi:hypothetical protein